ncbi:hypothetical protein Tco_0354613, partial [Tanacetum coccineum]
TNSYLGGIMVSLIFLDGIEEEALVEFIVEWFEEEEEALVEFIVEWFEEDEDDKKNEKEGLFNLKP